MAGAAPEGRTRALRPYVMADEPEPPPAVPASAPATPPPVPPPASAPSPTPAPPPPQTDRAGLALRPFLLTAGRVAGGGNSGPLPIEAQLVATAAGLAAIDGLTFEHRAIVEACRVPQSAAELAARLHLHLNVVRVIAGDLRSAGQLAVHTARSDTAQDVSVLRRVIDGLRAVPDSRGLPRGSRPA